MSVGEFEIIENYFKQLTRSRDDVITAIGDDCALLEAGSGKLLAVSTDTLVAGRHFFEDTDPFKLGYKCLAVNLSDLAAMGAEPCWVSLALTLPQASDTWLKAFSAGFALLAGQFNVQLIGGDMTQGPLSITLTVHGQVDRHQYLVRSGAMPGDLIYVSGQLGNAALALQKHLQACPVDAELENALLLPEPKVRLGQALVGIASSCIDVSDGLIADLNHICTASGCGAHLFTGQLPCHPLVLEETSRSGSWELPLSGGDDYQLCFTVPAGLQSKLQAIAGESGCVVSRVGVITQQPGITVFDRSGTPLDYSAKGYTHF